MVVWPSDGWLSGGWPSGGWLSSVRSVSNGGVNSRGVINRSDKKMLQTLLISCKLEMKLVFKLHPLY